MTEEQIGRFFQEIEDARCFFGIAGERILAGDWMYRANDGTIRPTEDSKRLRPRRPNGDRP